ncbi:MAG: hypothetical protein HS111_36565 [Kofleriaceae bacterium]|nr:hypothetical protein [Kofleriaceae bacterium]
MKLVAVLPKASRAVTCTAGVIATPATVVVGWTVKNSAAAAPGVMSNDALVAPVSPAALAASVYVPTSVAQARERRHARHRRHRRRAVQGRRRPAGPAHRRRR